MTPHTGKTGMYTGGGREPEVTGLHMAAATQHKGRKSKKLQVWPKSFLHVAHFWC